MNRRDFLVTSAALGAAAALPSVVLAREASKDVLITGRDGKTVTLSGKNRLGDSRYHSLFEMSKSPGGVPERKWDLRLSNVTHLGRPCVTFVQTDRMGTPLLSHGPTTVLPYDIKRELRGPVFRATWEGCRRPLYFLGSNFWSCQVMNKRLVYRSNVELVSEERWQIQDSEADRLAEYQRA